MCSWLSLRWIPWSDAVFTFCGIMCYRQWLRIAEAMATWCNSIHPESYLSSALIGRFFICPQLWEIRSFSQFFATAVDRVSEWSSTRMAACSRCVIITPNAKYTLPSHNSYVRPLPIMTDCSNGGRWSLLLHVPLLFDESECCTLLAQRSAGKLWMFMIDTWGKMFAITAVMMSFDRNMGPWARSSDRLEQRSRTKLLGQGKVRYFAIVINSLGFDISCEWQIRGWPNHSDAADAFLWALSFIWLNIWPDHRKEWIAPTVDKHV